MRFPEITIHGITKVVIEEREISPDTKVTYITLHGYSDYSEGEKAERLQLTVFGGSGADVFPVIDVTKVETKVDLSAV